MTERDREVLQEMATTDSILWTLDAEVQGACARALARIDELEKQDDEGAYPEGTRFVVVQNTFLRKLTAILCESIMHPRTNTIIRVIPKGNPRP